MLKFSSNRSRLAILLGLMACLFAAPVVAQDQNAAPTENAAPAATPVPVAIKPATPAKVSAPVPAWLPMAAIFGVLFGLVGTGLSIYLFLGKEQLEQRVNELTHDMQPLKVIPSAVNQIFADIPKDVADVICASLGYGQRKVERPNINGNLLIDINGALEGKANEMAFRQVDSYAAQNITPPLQTLQNSSAETQDYLTRFDAHFKQNDAQIKKAIGEIDRHATELQANLKQLDSETRDRLEALIFNLYNLVFTQSEGDPVVPKLENGVARYQKLFDDLRAIKPDDMTRLTLREFEEALAKLESRLEAAHTALAQAQQVEVDPLPYLDEEDRAQAGELLENQRKKLRGQTAAAKESQIALRDAVLELYKPLQTLWMGASVEDIDQPGRTRRCRALLEQIKAIFAAANVEIYEAPVGGEIDSQMVTYKFADQPHDAPLIAQKVTRLGLKVEERIEPGAVVVA